MVAHHQERIIKAEQALQVASEKVKDTPYRLGYHITAPAHWINDPNGLIQWNGDYHVFFQHHPFGPKGGPMHWGHVKSKDLVHWEHLPVALAPGDEFDKSGCFSGSAIEHDGQLLLFYTGHNNLNEDGSDFFEVQCVAKSSDGIHFEKLAGNPIISKPPENGSPHFRDPKVWKHEDTWYMVLGNQVDELGNVLLYESTDLSTWVYQGVIAQSEGKMGYMFECPDFFELEGKHILLFSPQGIEPEGDLYQNLYQNGTYIGDFDYQTKQFSHGQFTELDKGFDFYAGQTLLDDQGRRILLGWMSMWETTMPEQEHGWAGALTLPRELKFNEYGELSMVPIKELQQLRTAQNVVEPTMINDNVRLAAIKGDQLEMIAEFSLKDSTAEKFGINIRCSADGKQKTEIFYHTTEGKVGIDRNHSGHGEGGIRQSIIHRQDRETLKLHLFIDKSSLEVFVIDGETVMTARIYPDQTSISVELFSDSGDTKLIKLDAWELKNSWMGIS